MFEVVDRDWREGRNKEMRYMLRECRLEDVDELVVEDVRFGNGEEGVVVEDVGIKGREVVEENVIVVRYVMGMGR